MCSVTLVKDETCQQGGMANHQDDHAIITCPSNLFTHHNGALIAEHTVTSRPPELRFRPRTLYIIIFFTGLRTACTQRRISVVFTLFRPVVIN